MNCTDCIHVEVCYRRNMVPENYADKCGDFLRMSKRMTRWEQWLKDKELTRAEIICRFSDCTDCPFFRCEKTKGYSSMNERFLDEEVEEDEDE